MQLCSFENQKYMSIRYIVWICAALIIGILCAYGYMVEIHQLPYAVFLLFFTIIILLIIKKKYSWLKLIIACLVFFILGLLVFNFQFNFIYNKRIGYRENVKVKATISDTTILKNGYIYGYLKNPIIINNEKEIELDGFVYIRTIISNNEMKNVDVGDTIIFNCNIGDNYPYKDGVNATMIKNNAYYYIENIKNDITLIKGDADFKEKIRIFIKDTLILYMGQETASVAIGMVLGDVSLLENDLADAYRKSGLSHIYSVSGLHVGFITMLMGVILNSIIKKNKWISVIITFTVATFYSYICGFPPTAIRSVVMSMVYLILRPYRNMDLSICASISLIFLLVFNPSLLFDGGCQMSFAAVYGMGTITKQINVYIKRYIKNKFIKKLCESVSLCVGATIGTLPFVVMYYGEISVLSVIANLIAVSLMTYAFFMIIFAMLPFMHAFLIIPSMIISFINKIVNVIASLPFATISVTNIGWGLVVWIFLMLLMSGMINIKGIAKIASIVALSIIIVFIGMSYAAPVNCKNIVTVTNYDFSYVSNSRNEILVLSNVENIYNAYGIENELYCYKNAEISICVTEINKSDKNAFEYLMKSSKINLKAVYSLNDLPIKENEAMACLRSEKILFTKFQYDTFKGFVVDIQYQNSKNKKYSALLVKLDREKNVLFLDNNIDEIEMGKLNEKLSLKFDVIICNQNIYAADRIFKTNIMTNKYAVGNKIFSGKVLGRFTFDIEYGIIKNY
ncbi:MAG: ComEC/Rec2 family competence protein [Clostridia bacterium]